MTTLRTAAQQALEALYQAREHVTVHTDGPWQRIEQDCHEAITALRAALAEPQEPAPMPLFPPVPLWKRGCAVCGIGAGGHAYGYACPRSDCPTRVTCGGGAV